MVLFYSGPGGREPPGSLLCPSHRLADEVERDKAPAQGWKGTPAPIMSLPHHRRDTPARPTPLRRGGTGPAGSTSSDTSGAVCPAKTAIGSRRESTVERALWSGVLNTCAGGDTFFYGS